MPLKKGPNKKFGLPHFGLAKAKSLDPNLLVRSKTDEMGAVFLAFSSVLNDVKGVMWLDAVLLDSRPDDSTPDEMRGQWHGIHGQVTKYILGIVHEFVVLIKKKRDLVLSDEMEGYVRMLPKPARKKWRTVVEVALATGGDTGGDIAGYLARVRNNLSFHYYDPKTLAKEFLDHFDKDSDDPRYSQAFISNGLTMAASRYYYADAAVESAIQAIFGSDDVNRHIRQLIEDINGSVSGMILAFIQTREREAHSG